MEYYTVKTLKEKMEALIAEGLENKYIVIPTDEEGNDYRALPNQDVLKTKEQIEEYLGEDGEAADHLYVKIEDCVVL